MFRVFLYIALVVLCGWGFATLASSHGDLAIMSNQMRIATSPFVAISLLISVAIATYLLWSLIKAIFGSPYAIGRRYQEKRKQQQQNSLSQGLIAILSGDHITARRISNQLNKAKNSDNAPLLNLLEAQTLSLEGDHSTAIKLYDTMRADQKTQVLGLHGLYCEALKTGAFEAAIQYAEEASSLSPSLDWANRAVLESLASEREWKAAILLFNKMEKALPRKDRQSPQLNHQRAVLYTGQAIDTLQDAPHDARRLALEAHQLDPDFIPAANIAARILFQLHETRKASKIVEAVWKKTPHRDLANTYLYASHDETAINRLKRAKTLAAKNPEHFDSLMCIASAAYEAEELELARENIEKAIRLDARESCFLLLADIEQAASNDQGLIRQWLSRALKVEPDPVWMADGLILAEWAPVSPKTRCLDKVEWAVPPRQLSQPIERDELLTLEIAPATAKNTNKQVESPTPPQKHSAADTTEKSSEKEPENFVHRVVDAPDDSDDDEKNVVTKARLNVDDPGVSASDDDFKLNGFNKQRS